MTNRKTIMMTIVVCKPKEALTSCNRQRGVTGGIVNIAVRLDLNTSIKDVIGRENES